MLPMKRPRLSAVTAHPDCLLSLTFINGQQVTVDLSRDIHTYPGLNALVDPNIFTTARLADDGWAVEWLTSDIQIGADTLYRDAFLPPDPNPHPAWAAHTAH
ncbi:DUF2442 domain-containing protein [Pseudomonas sp. PB106]|nr:DUF2442 domain-containing protein [Pseudomonas sp. PB106]